MSQDMPWFKCNPAEWLQSCADMESEEFGYYARLILFMYQRGGMAPFCEGKLRHIWNCSKQRARKVRDELIGAGRIEQIGDSLTQSRVKRELRIAETIDLELAEKSAKTSQKSSKNPAKIGQVFSDNPLKTNETEKQIPDTRYQIPENHTLQRAELDELSTACLEAAGKAMADPARSPAVMVMSVPLSWLKSGADLNFDIVPILKARSANRPPGSVNNWQYFTSAVMEAKAKREAGHLTPEIPDGKSDYPTRGGRPANPYRASAEAQQSAWLRAVEEPGSGGSGDGGPERQTGDCGSDSGPALRLASG